MMYLRFYNRTASLWNERACMGLAIMAASGMVAFIQNLITCFAGEVDFPLVLLWWGLLGGVLTLGFQFKFRRMKLCRELNIELKRVWSLPVVCVSIAICTNILFWVNQSKLYIAVYLISLVSFIYAGHKTKVALQTPSFNKCIDSYEELD